MKVVIPEDLKGKELFKFLMENKSALIAQKKSIIKISDAIICPAGNEVVKLFITKEGKLSEKAAGAQAATADEEDDTVLVKVVGNACWWCDDQLDVLIDDSAKKTIQQRKGLIPHLPDHTHKLEAQVGDVEDVYLEDVSLRKLGLDKSGATQCIVMESLVRKSYNPRVYALYKAGKVYQHSIGLQYVRIELAINDPDYEKQIDFWNKYYKNILNKEVVDETGYFWVVQEIKLLEISGVLFGSNELTPTLETRAKGSSTETAIAASQEESANDNWDLDVAIRLNKFKF